MRRRSSGTLWTVAALLLALTACRAPLAALTRHKELVTPAGSFSLNLAESDRDSEEMLRLSLARAGEKLARWGGLREPVQLHVLPTHALLERAVGRYGYGWMRAWAQYDLVFLQSPRSWWPLAATQGDLNETLLHELTHCVMYQQAASSTTWARKEIPLWFREGMASYTAEQGYRRPTLEDLAQYLARHPGADPLLASPEMYRSEDDIVYGAAHHAFAFLVRRYGEEGVRRVLQVMAAGNTFPRAFEDAIGLSANSFASEFRRYVRFRGFRGGRLRPAEPAPADPP
jgi:hypothetical protein